MLAHRGNHARSTGCSESLGPLDRTAVERLVLGDLAEPARRAEIKRAAAVPSVARRLAAAGTAVTNIRRGTLAMRTLIDVLADGEIAAVARLRSGTSKRALAIETLEAETVDVLCADIGAVDTAWVVLAHPDAAAHRDVVESAIARVQPEEAPEPEAALPPVVVPPVPLPSVTALPTHGIVSPDDLMSAIAPVSQALADVKGGARSMRKSLDEVTLRLDKLGARGDQQAHDNSANLARLAASGDAANARIGELESAVAQLRASKVAEAHTASPIELLRTEVRPIKHQLDGLASEITSMRAQQKLDGADAERKRQEARLVHLEDRVEALPSLIASALLAATGGDSASSEPSPAHPLLQSAARPASPAEDDATHVWHRRLAAVSRSASASFGPGAPETLFVDGHNVINGHVNHGVFGSEPEARAWLVSSVVQLAELLELDRVFLCFDTRHDNLQDEPVSDRVRVLYGPRKDGGADALIGRLVEERTQNADLLVVSSDYKHVWTSSDHSRSDGWNVRSVSGRQFFEFLCALEDCMLTPVVPRDRLTEALLAAAVPARPAMPRKPKGTVSSAKEAVLEGDFDRAIREYTEMYNSDSSNHTILVGRARARALAGDVDGALDDLRLAERHLPNYAAIPELRRRIVASGRGIGQ